MKFLPLLLLALLTGCQSSFESKPPTVNRYVTKQFYSGSKLFVVTLERCTDGSVWEVTTDAETGLNIKVKKE